MSLKEKEAKANSFNLFQFYPFWKKNVKRKQTKSCVIYNMETNFITTL